MHDNLYILDQGVRDVLNDLTHEHYRDHLKFIA